MICCIKKKTFQQKKRLKDCIIINNVAFIHITWLNHLLHMDIINVQINHIVN